MKNRLHDIIECCYSAIDDPVHLGVATTMIGEAIDADAGDIVSEFSVERRTRTYGSFGFDPGFLDNYDSEYLGENPWLDNLLRLPTQTIHTDDVFTAGYHQSRYYNEWVLPQGLDNAIGAVIENTPNVMQTWVGFVRGAGCAHFGEQERAFLGQVMPHLRRALRVLGSIDDQAARQSSMRSMCDTLNAPVFLLNAAGGLVFKNAMAESFLNTHDGLYLTANGRLAARRTKTDEALRVAVKSSAGRPVIVPLEGGGQTTALTVVPLEGVLQGTVAEARVAVFASGAGVERDIDIEPVAQLYRLTRTEAKLALSIAKGDTLAGFAAQNGGSITTARWHLKNLESKTGTKRLDELMLLILHTVAPVRLK